MDQHPGSARISGTAPRLVGRRLELTRVGRLLDTAAGHTPGVLLVEGATGIGKTTLLGAAADIARQRGFQVGTASASRLEKELPFAVTRQVFEDVLDELSPAEIESVVLTAGRRGSSVINATPADPLSRFEDMEVHQALQGLHRLVVALCERGPLCLVIDDLQWTDVPSLRWLNYLVRRALRLPLAVLMSRTTGTRPEDALLVAELDFYAERTVLGGFADDEIAEYTERVLGAQPVPEFVSTCADATSRNPFILGQLLSAMKLSAVRPDADTARDLARFGPADLGESVLARLNRQAPPLVRLARIVAVLEPANVKLAAAVANLSLPEATDGVEQLVRMGMLVVAGDRPAFAHSMIQNAVTNAVSHTERDELHARAAQYLHQIQAPDLLVAKHITHTTTRLGTWAATTLAKAADLAVMDGDPETGAAMLSRALVEEIMPDLRRDLLIRLGMAETYFDPHQAAVHLREAMEHLAEPSAVFLVATRLAQVLHLDARYDDAREVLVTAIEKVEPADPAVADLLRLALRVTVPSPHPEADGVSAGDFDAHWRGGSPLGRQVAALVCENAGNIGEDPQLCREAAQVALSGGAASIMHEPQRLLAAINGLMRVDEFELALRYCTETVVEAHQQGLSLLSVLGHTLRSRVHLFHGALAECVTDARLAMSAGRTSNVHPRHYAYVQTVEALVQGLVRIGDFEGAKAALEPIGLVGSLPRSWQHTALLHARGFLRMETGDPEGALADQLECGERLTAWGAPSPVYRPWRSHAAMAHLKLGRRQLALDLALEELTLARKWNTPSSVGRALLAVGRVTGGAEAIPWLAEAQTVMTRSTARLLRARVLMALGAARWHHGQRDAGREDLAQAKLLAEKCGALPVLVQLAELPTEAVVRSESLPSLPATPSLPLTPHEYRVASLVVAGNSNDEIARKLCVSRRAIEFHLTNIYRKLGVRRRTQLSSALTTLPPQD